MYTYRRETTGSAALSRTNVESTAPFNRWASPVLEQGEFSQRDGLSLLVVWELTGGSGESFVQIRRTVTELLVLVDTSKRCSGRSEQEVQAFVQFSLSFSLPFQIVP